MIYDLWPSQGPYYGENIVYIYGSGFEGVQSVKFGDKEATILYVDPMNISCSVPSGLPDGLASLQEGYYPVTISVTNEAGTVVAPTRYTYIACSLDYMDPLSGQGGAVSLGAIWAKYVDKVYVENGMGGGGGAYATDVVLTPMENPNYVLITCTLPAWNPGTLARVTVEDSINGIHTPSVWGIYYQYDDPPQ